MEQKMDLWFTEKQTEILTIGCKVSKTIHSEKTEFQDLAVIDTLQYGRMLVLDGVIMTTVKDEFVYHEMMSHVPLNTHTNPKNVLVVGGGDGGVIREIIKHPAVEHATLVEIDRRVVEVSKEYLPEIACGLDDPKVTVIYDDGIKHVLENPDTYDVIIVDSTDPVGPAVELFSGDFYQSVFRALKEDGVFVAQTESPFVNADLVTSCYKRISAAFPMTKVYLGHIPTYPTGMWSFTMGTKKHDPEKVDISKIPSYPTRYYTPEIHKAAFVLPKFVQELLADAVK